MPVPPSRLEGPQRPPSCGTVGHWKVVLQAHLQSVSFLCWGTPAPFEGPRRSMPKAHQGPPHPPRWCPEKATLPCTGSIQPSCGHPPCPPPAPLPRTSKLTFVGTPGLRGVPGPGLPAFQHGHAWHPECTWGSHSKAWHEHLPFLFCLLALSVLSGGSCCRDLSATNTRGKRSAARLGFLWGLKML